MQKLIELELPNTLGSEKIAIEEAVSIAKEMGFSQNRIEDLKTAVAEACINAIEHGNKFNENAKMGITLAASDKSLKVVVNDEGEGIDEKNIPTVHVDGKGMPNRRGHGVYLIKNLVNEFSFEKKTGKKNEVRMIIHLNK